jgi:hypothetical protein
MFSDRLTDKYSLKGDLEHLRKAGKHVLSRTETAKGWCILWYDAKGYTVSHTTAHARGNGAARPLAEAHEEYIETVRSLS